MRARQTYSNSICEKLEKKFFDEDAAKQSREANISKLNNVNKYIFNKEILIMFQNDG